LLWKRNGIAGPGGTNRFRADIRKRALKRSDFFQRKKGDGTPFFPVPGQNPREDYARIHFQISFGVAFFP
jgi:hypothetical protein